MFKPLFPLSVSKSFLLLAPSSPCDLFFIFYFVLLRAFQINEVQVSDLQ